MPFDDERVEVCQGEHTINYTFEDGTFVLQSLEPEDGCFEYLTVHPDGSQTTTFPDGTVDYQPGEYFEKGAKQIERALRRLLD